MIFQRFRQWHETRKLRRLRVTEAQWQAAVADWHAIRHLNPGDRNRLRELSLRFLLRKRLEAGGDLAINDAMQLRVATMAALPVLNLGLDWYDGWRAVILYPAEFVPNREYEDEAGVVHLDRHPLSGEAWLQGPVILSWEDVRDAGREPGCNVVIHEMAHKLDMLMDGANGCPPLHRGMDPAVWQQTFTDAWDDLEARDAAGESLPIDPYALEDPAEFFSVVSEGFFEDPSTLADTWPELYGQLAAFYRQDPLARQS